MKKIALVLIVGGFMILSGLVHAVPLIDFETVPGNTSPAVGDPITDQYEEKYGVSFRIDNPGEDTMFLGDYDGAREGWRCRDSSLDCLLSPADNGTFFLAHPDAGTKSLRDLYIDYSKPVSALGFDLLDIDGLERWLISAIDSAGNIVSEKTISTSYPGTGDGLSTRVTMDVSSSIIQSVRISFTGSPNPYIGFGFDNFTPITTDITTASEPSPYLLMLGGLSLLTFARYRTVKVKRVGNV